MTCNEIKELTVPYLELDLEPSRVREVTTHLEGCAGCRAEMEAVRQVLVRVRGMAVPDPGDQFWREFLHRIRRELVRLQSTAMTPGESSRFQRFWGRTVTAQWTLALAASLLLVVGVWLLTGPRSEGPVSGPSGQSLEQAQTEQPLSAQLDLPTVGDADWHDYWEVDPDAALVEIARQLDRQTLDRIFTGI
jgi:hypothetical protein